MTHKHLLDAESAALLILGTTIACVADKWDEKEPDKGHKVGRRRHALRAHSHRSRSRQGTHPKDPSTLYAAGEVFGPSTKTEQKAIVQPSHFFTSA